MPIEHSNGLKVRDSQMDGLGIQIKGDKISKPDFRGLPDKDHQGRPYIYISPNLGELADEALKVLRNVPGSPQVFQRGNELVRVLRDISSLKIPGMKRPPGPDIPIISRFTKILLGEYMTRVSCWMKFDMRGEKWRHITPLLNVIQAILDRGVWPLPRLEGVITAPTIRSDGSIINKTGYDPATGLLYEPGDIRFPDVPDAPTLEDALQAERVIREVFEGFPFSDSKDWAAALGAILTVIARGIIFGPVPLFTVRANVPGAGKGRLVEIISIIGTGCYPALMAATDNPEEHRKMLLAIAQTGMPVVCFDNIDFTFGSGPLAAALTTNVITDRVLGESRTLTLPLKCCFFATGNNLSFKGDLGRRAVPIDLFSKLENPEDRKDFKYPDIVSYVKKIRPRLVVSVLTILRAYQVAGRPETGKPKLGSFETWDDVIRAPLCWLGFDPCATRQRLREEGDEDKENLEVLLTAWEGAFQKNPATVRQALNQFTTELPEALSAFDERGKPDKPNARSIGRGLSRICKRVLNGRRLEKAAPVSGVAQYRVVCDV